MTAAIGFALLSLLFAAVLEVAYKCFSMKPRSRGIYLAGIGFVWGAMQLGFAAQQGLSFHWTAHGLYYALAAGIAVAASNLLLIESMTRIEASLGSTIYRLNTVAVVILSFAFLGENIGLLKFAAISFGVAAVLTLYGGVASSGGLEAARFYFWLAMVASLLRACFGVISKAALNEGIESAVIMLTSAGCWIIGGLLYAALRERVFRLTWDSVGYSLVTGVLVFLVVNTLLRGLELGEASTVIPIANLSFVAVLAISVATRMEKLTTRKSISIAFAAVCIWLMTAVA